MTDRTRQGDEIMATLLIVDDDPEFCALIRHTAPGWLDTIAFSSTSEAIGGLGAPCRQAIDMALIDIHMPPFLAELAEEEGPSLVRWMEESGFAVPTILVSAKHHADQAAIGRRPSIVGFLRKPLDLRELYEFLRTYARLFDRPGGRKGGRVP